MASAQTGPVDLTEVLSSLTGQRVRIGEIITALNLGRSTYYEQRDDGRLVSPDNMLRLAAEMDLNPIELLLRCGLISQRAVDDFIANATAGTRHVREPRTRRFQRRPDAPPL